MNDNAEIVKLNLKIERLEARVNSEKTMKCELRRTIKGMMKDSNFASRLEKRDDKKMKDRIQAGATKTMRVLINLVDSGKVKLSNDDIAGICFVTAKAVYNCRWLMTKGSCNA